MQEQGPVKVTVRDARRGRALAGRAEGKVLMEFETDRLYLVGDRLWLPDDTEVEVIDMRVTYSASGVEETLHIGDVR
jgi:hypothetical protein